MTNIKDLADKFYPPVELRIEVTVPQMKALFRKWKESDQDMSWHDFAKSAGVGSFGCIMVQWCGMWLGIEEDGYTHS